MGLLVVAFADEVEERIVVVVDVVDADLEDTLPFFRMRLDELHADVEVMERFHAEVVLFAVVFDCIDVGPGIIAGRNRESEIVVEVFGGIGRGGQSDGIAGGENPRQREIDPRSRAVHQHDGDIMTAVVAGKEGFAEVELVELLLGP